LNDLNGDRTMSGTGPKTTSLNRRAMLKTAAAAGAACLAPTIIPASALGSESAAGARST
jgi:hypothetical protein